MRKPKLHWHYTAYWDSWPELVNVADCGREYVATTTNIRQVTCKVCRKLRRSRYGGTK